LERLPEVRVMWLVYIYLTRQPVNTTGRSFLKVCGLSVGTVVVRVLSLGATIL
jgi:hypothetical protein